MCAIDIFKNKIMKSKFCVKKCQENVLQFMFLYIIRTPLLELKSVGKKCGLYTGKDGSCMANLSKFQIVFSSSTLIHLNKDAFEVHLCQTVNNFVK